MTAVHPLTGDRWDDLAALFGPRGAVAGCWCMWWRQSSAEHSRHAGAGNRNRLRDLARSEEPPGLLAYRDGEPVGWCSVGPRAAFARLERSPVAEPVAVEPTWSVLCFYIGRGHRRQGVAAALLEAAVAHAAGRGAAAIEGYPVDPAEGKVASGDAFTGTLALFAGAGFTEVARHRPRRPVMRRSL